VIALRHRARLLADRLRPAEDERGVVLVWTAIMIVVFLGVAAFAVDVAYWHLVKGREQKAADAAALAGAVTFPGNHAASDAAAIDVASRNGYAVGSVSQIAANATCPLGVGDVALCTGPGVESFQYKVTVVHRVDNIFGGIFGLGQTTIRATGTAEYLKPLSMGSPSNQFGNDPDNTTWPVDPSNPPQSYPNIWGNIEGGGTAKQQGDAYAANWCDNSVTDGCNGTGDAKNVNYTANGYYYTVDFTSDGPAKLQVFDPAFVNVGNFCTAGNLAAAATTNPIPNYPQGPGNTADIAKRFAPPGPGASNNPSDPGLQYGTGDQSFTNSAGANVAPATKYTVLKASVPGDPSTATNACPPITFPGYNGDVSVPLKNGTTQAGAPGPFATYFRQWYDLCTINGTKGDEYFIQVQTDNGGGSNHFSLRGVSSGNTPAPVTIAGNTYMSLFANVGVAHTKFYLARVPSAAAGHTLVLNFYDIGDADSVGQLQVLPPDDSNVGASFSGCTWTGSNSNNIGYAANTVNAPWGPDGAITDCKVTGVNTSGTTWNAQWSTVKVPIPHNYTCNDDDPFGCWLKIDYNFAGAVHDVTSWNAYLLGDPVRLVQ
jgi:Flp pilus assembly protein TadG